MAQVEPFTGPGDPDVTEASLFLELVGVAEAAGVREDAVLQAGEEDDRELEALGGVQRHQRDRALLTTLAVGVVEIGDQRDRLEEGLDARQALGDHDVTRRGIGGAHPGDAGQSGDVAGVERHVELAAHPHQLLQVLDPAARLDRTLGLELGQVAGLFEDRLDRRGDAVRGHGLDAGHQLEQIADAAQCLAAHAGIGGVGESLAERHPGTLRVRRDPVDRRVPHPTFGRVDHASPAHFVVRIHERAQVGKDVLDLATVVELHPTHDAVRHPGAHEGLLDDATLRVGAVEDGDVTEALVLVVDQAPDLVDDECSFIVLVLRVIARDELATDLLGPQVLRAPRRVVGDDRVGGVEDALTRPVVLVHHDDRGLGKLLLEPQQVPEVSPAEFVHRVVGDDPLGDEVVRPLDVEVVDRDVEIEGLDSGHDVEPPRIVHHDHAFPYRRRRKERQGVGVGVDIVRREPCDRADRDIEDLGDTPDRVLDDCHVGVAGLEPPTARPAASGPHAEPQAFEGRLPLVVVTEQGNPVHRRATPTIATEDHREPSARLAAGRTRIRRRHVMRVLEVQAVIVEQFAASLVRVEILEESIDQRLVADETARSGRCGVASHEGQRRQAVAGGEERFLEPALGLGGVNAHHPERVGVFLCAPPERTEHGVDLGLRVGARSSDAEAQAFLPHDVGVVELRSPADHEPGEVHMVGGRHHTLAAAEGDRGALRSACLVDTQHAGRAEIAAAITRQHFVALAYLLDRPSRSVGHGDGRALDQTLILVTDHHHVAVLLGEHPHELPLRDVGVLELVDQHVVEPTAPAGQDIGMIAEQVHGLHEEVVEVERRRLEQAPLVLPVHLRDALLGRGERTVDGLLPRHQVVLHRRDGRVQPTRREPLRVHVEVAPHVVDEADGVGLVVDRERRPVTEDGRVAPEDARAHRVERRHPHLLGDGTDQVRHPRLHLARGLVGERDRGEPER